MKQQPMPQAFESWLDEIKIYLEQNNTTRDELEDLAKSLLEVYPSSTYLYSKEIIEKIICLEKHLSDVYYKLFESTHYLHEKIKYLKQAASRLGSCLRYLNKPCPNRYTESTMAFHCHRSLANIFFKLADLYSQNKKVAKHFECLEKNLFHTSEIHNHDRTDIILKVKYDLAQAYSSQYNLMLKYTEEEKQDYPEYEDSIRKYYNQAIQYFWEISIQTPIEEKRTYLIEINKLFGDIKRLNDYLALKLTPHIYTILVSNEALPERFYQWVKNAEACLAREDSKSQPNQTYVKLSYACLIAVSMCESGQAKRLALIAIGKLRLKQSRESIASEKKQRWRHDEDRNQQIHAFISQTNLTDQDYEAIFQYALRLLCEGDIQYFNAVGYMASGDRYLSMIAPHHAHTAYFLGRLYQELTPSTIPHENASLFDEALYKMQLYYQARPECYKNLDLPDLIANHFIVAIRMGHVDAAHQLSTFIDRAEFNTFCGLKDTFKSIQRILDIATLYCEDKITISKEKTRLYLLEKLAQTNRVKGNLLLCEWLFDQHKYNEAIQYLIRAAKYATPLASMQDSIPKTDQPDPIITRIQTRLDALTSLSSNDAIFSSIEGDLLFELSECYTSGTILTKNTQKGYVLLEQAALKNNRAAKKILADQQTEAEQNLKAVEKENPTVSNDTLFDL